MKNKLSIILVGVLIAVLLTIIFIALPKSANLTIAFVFSLVGTTLFTLSLLVIAHKPVKVLTTIPFALIAWVFLVLNLLLSALGVIFQNVVPPLLLGLLHGLLIVIFAIPVILISIGKRHIDKTDDKTNHAVRSIRTQLDELSSMKAKTTDMPNDIKGSVDKEIQKVYEALRYSDPLTPPGLEQYDTAISNGISEIKDALATGDLNMIQGKTRQAVLLINERNSAVRTNK